METLSHKNLTSFNPENQSVDFQKLNKYPSIEIQADNNSDLAELLISEFNLPFDIDPNEIPSVLRQKINESYMSLNSSQTDLFSEKQKIISSLQKQIIDLQNENENLKEKYENDNYTSKNKNSLSEMNIPFNNTNINNTNNKDKFTDTNIPEQFNKEAMDQIIELQKECYLLKEKQKDFIKALARSENECKAANKVAQDLQIELDKLNAENFNKNCKNQEFENQEIKRLQNKIEYLKKDNQSLKESLDKLSSELSLTSNELNQENEDKNKLFLAIQKLNVLLSKSESNIEIIEGQNQKLLEENRKLKNQISQYEKSNKNEKSNDSNNENILSGFYDFISEVPDKTTQLQMRNYLLEEDLSISDRILSSCRQLNQFLQQKLDQNQIIEQQKLKAIQDSISQKSNSQNNRLIQYINNLYHFISNVANSTQIQDWLIDSNDRNIRQELQSECSRVELFLVQNNLQKCDPNQENDSFLNFSNYVLKTFDSINLNNNPESKELLLILRQCSLANDILRKYSSHLSLKIEDLLSQQKEIKNEYEIAKENNEKELAEAKITISRALASFSMISHELQNNPNFDQRHYRKLLPLNLLKSNGNKNHELQIDKIFANLKFEKEKQLQEELFRVNNELLQVKNDLKQQNEESCEIITSLKQNKKEFRKKALITFEKYEKRNNALQQQLNETKATVVDLSQAKDQLENINNDLLSTIEVKNKQYEQLKQMKSEEISENDKLFQKQLKILHDEKLQISQEFQDTVKELNTKYSKEIQDLEQKIKEQDINTKELKQYYETIINALKNNIKESNDNEIKTQTSLTEAKIKIKKFKNELNKAIVSNKILTIKLNQKDDEIKRNQLLFTSQNKVQLIEMENQYQSQVDSIAFQNQHVLDNFIREIACKFNEYINFSSPLTTDSILILLDKVKDIIIKSEKQASQINVLQKIEEALSVSNESDAYWAVISLINNQKGQIKEKEKEKQEKQIKETNHDNKPKSKEDQYLILEDNDNNLLNINSDNNLNQNVQESNSITAQDWEKWARQLNTFISSDLALWKGPKELQTSLEEIILGSTFQRQIVKKLEILRNEKKLFSSGVLFNTRNKSKQGKLSLKSLIVMTKSIYRLQKMSGHIQIPFPQ